MSVPPDRERPGLREALAACREGDTLVVTKLDRLLFPVLAVVAEFESDLTFDHGGGGARTSSG